MYTRALIPARQMPCPRRPRATQRRRHSLPFTLPTQMRPSSTKTRIPLLISLGISFHYICSYIYAVPSSKHTPQKSYPTCHVQPSIAHSVADLGWPRGRFAFSDHLLLFSFLSTLGPSAHAWREQWREGVEKQPCRRDDLADRSCGRHEE